MESLDHAILVTLEQKGAIDLLKTKIAEKRRWLGPAAREVQENAREHYTQEEGDLLAAFAVLTQKMEAFRNHVAEREAQLNQIYRSLHNPSETGKVVIHSKSMKNCFDAITPEITQIILKVLAEHAASHVNGAVALRKALFFFDSGMVLSAAKPLWGGIGAALLHRKMADIVYGAGVICIAKDTAGVVVALVRAGPATVVAVEAETKKVRWAFEAGIAQNRDGSSMPDAATMAFDDDTEFYVVNKKRFVCRNGRCTMASLEPPKLAGNTIRINRFSRNVPNKPYYAHPPTLTPTETEAPPFYVTGHYGQNYVTLQVNAKSTVVVAPELPKVRFYCRRKIAQDPANAAACAVPVYSNAFQDQVSVRRANLDTVIFRMPELLRTGEHEIESVARIARFLFVKIAGEASPRLAWLPENLYKIASVMTYAAGAHIYAAVVAIVTTHDEDVVPVTVFAKLVAACTIATGEGHKRTGARNILASLIAGLNAEATKNISALEKMGQKAKFAKKIEDALVAKPAPLVVKNHWAGIVRGKHDDAFVQFGSALVRVAPGTF